ncbi:hypothetical protein CXF68_07385 [Tenacibaculum sp. Bg11-29]|uniref:hypothetical protein n=1 Tax=Tenacibaculum sp. Bg11-29 TaxID=2058306 RepID=UPI000C32530C|nr:hypothetical protein [Tenacibaculum sp. Bg11-29]PKH50528.1 hypothetical protein CXF68_07385 [Tenacibaculum sp. Bg11-29]
MYGISTGITITKGHKQSILANFKNGDMFHLDNNEITEIDKLITQRFFKKKDISIELFIFLSENRMIYKIQQGIEQHFPKQKQIYESKHKIEYLTLTYSNITYLNKTIQICNTLKIPSLLIQVNDNIIDLLEKLIEKKTYPESVTIITNNKSILARKNLFRILITEENLGSFTNRDTIDLNYPLFIESHSYHNYFNKKIHITFNGEIKNTPESPESFANLKEKDFTEKISKAIISKKFQKYWKVHKDICDVCKNCEFRYMCVDNRIPQQRKLNEWYHKTECNYNPFIAKWKKEKGYKSLEKTGVISNHNKFFISHLEKKTC